jgi:hypothetical protein
VYEKGALLTRVLAGKFPKYLQPPVQSYSKKYINKDVGRIGRESVKQPIHRHTDKRIYVLEPNHQSEKPIRNFVHSSEEILAKKRDAPLR